MLKQLYLVGLGTCHALKMAGFVVVVMLLREKIWPKLPCFFKIQAEYILINIDNLSYCFPFSFSHQFLICQFFVTLSSIAVPRIAPMFLSNASVVLLLHHNLLPHDKKYF